MTRVTHPPSGNLVQIVRQRMVAVSRNPTPFTQRPCFHRCAVPRSCHQWMHIPNWEREKVMNTLIEYMITRYFTDPPVIYSIR